MADLVMPPPDRLINLVGFLNSSNGRKCADHTCCGIDLLADTPSGGAGTLLRLVKTSPNEIAAYIVLPDENIGCRVGFAQRQYAADGGADLYDGATVKIIALYTADHENSSCRALAHRNFGYAPAEIISYANEGL